LAIVREKVEMLGGTVFFETEKDVGTQFHMALPLTVVTFRGILVRSVGRDFVFPTMYVERVLRMNQDVVKSVENCETIELDGQPVSLVWLSEVLELSSESRMLENPNRINLIVLDAEGTRIAFLVDAVISEQEVLLKPLGRQLSRIRNISGATVMGNGQVVPIINVPDLLKSASHIRSPKEGRIPVEIPEFVARKRSVLIAEDSITTRSLLKNILEAAGFEVVTAVDGLDAFALLKTRRFDIVVSDVEMPRMDGFELVTKIRSDLKLSELPVVLVTAQASREDQERGIDVGANAYIVKSGFDQNNLLDAIGKLMIKEALG